MPIVGKNIPRLDAKDKVLGKALYVDDIDIPGMWHGAVVRTSVPHGKIKGVELDPAFDWRKVVIADASDIPGKNCVAMIEEDLPLIVDDVTKHVGEAVRLIAAPTRELALEAASHVKVTYEEMEPVLSIEDSKKIISKYEIKKGDVDAAFKEAHTIVEGTYKMGYQEHMYIEPQGMIAHFDDDKQLKLIGSLQCPYYVSKALSILMNMPEDRISVRQAVVGGAFGGKEDYPSVLAGYAAVLANKCKRPVKIAYERMEDTLVTTKRHPAIVFHRTGVKKDGTIVAMDIIYKLDAGAYVTLTPVVLSRGIIHSAGPYKCENVRCKAYAYETNTPPNGAFRGFGAPQAFFPLEVHMDQVAHKLGMSPLKFRQKNCLRIGDETATGQKLTNSVGSEEVLKEATKRSDFEKRFKKYASTSKGSRIKRGIGMSFFMHGAGFTGSGEAILKGKAGFRLDEDGRICVLTACTEMGQGAHTVIPQMAADHLGIDLSCISIETPDTAIVPNSGPTVASRTTMIMGIVLGKCAAKLKDELISFAAETYKADASILTFQGVHLKKDGKDISTVSDLVKSYLSSRGPLTIIDHYELPPEIKWDEKTYRGDAYPTYAWGCDVAEVEVDMDTFEVHVIKMWLAQDIGKAINPKLASGQIEGGTLQALGYAIMEKHVLDRGNFVSCRLQTYMIPTAMDAPDMETTIVEKAYEHGPMGAKGVGELPMDGGAPAIANAIANATGIRVCELPITPESLFKAWKEGKA